MITYSPNTTYTSVWSKYRPAVLRLMVASAQGPQQYQFSDHEFRRLNPRAKSGYAFTLQLFQGKAINNIKASEIAKDLLLILKQSKTALELSESCVYEINLDKHFVLHVTKSESEQKVSSEDAVADQLAA